MSYITPAQLKQVVQAQKNYTDDAGFMKNIGFYNNLVPAASQSVSKVIIDGVTYYMLGGLSNVKAGYAYYVTAVNNVDYWDTFVCLQVVNGTALFWPFRAISGSVPNNVTARKHVFVIDENGKNDTIKYSVDPHAGTGYRSIMQRDANGRSQVNDPSANLDVANKQWTLAQISSLGKVFNIKGTVSTVSALPASGNNVGDVYFVTADSSEYVWTSSNAWEQFGPTIDINGAIDTRLASKYDIYEDSGLLSIGSTSHNLYFTGDTAITLETADAGSGNGIELYDSYGYNYLRVNSTAGITLLADHKFNISAAGGDTYVRTDDAVGLHLYGSGGVQVDGAFRIESDSPNASPFHYDAGCIQMCNGKVYLDYATNINYTTNTFNIAIPNLYKTFNQNTMQYSNPYVSSTDYASSSQAGVVKVDSSRGLAIGSDGRISTNPAGTGSVKAGASSYLPITPLYQHQAVFYALSKASGIDLASSTAETAPDGTNPGVYPARSKTAIQSLLGIKSDIAHGNQISQYGVSPDTWDYYAGISYGTLYFVSLAFGDNVDGDTHNGWCFFYIPFNPTGNTGGGCQQPVTLSHREPSYGGDVTCTLIAEYDTNIMGEISLQLEWPSSVSFDYGNIYVKEIRVGQ